MSGDASVAVDWDDPGDGAEEEEDEANDDHVVEQSGVVLATPKLTLLFPVDCNDEVEGRDDDNEDTKDADSQGNAAPQCLDVGVSLGLYHGHQLGSVVSSGVDTLTLSVPAPLSTNILIHDHP